MCVTSAAGGEIRTIIIQQRYIEPLNESHMYPNKDDKKKLQDAFDQLNASYGRPTYELCQRALEAAHRVRLTPGTEYRCTLCSNADHQKNRNHARWELFNRFNMMVPSPAPKVLQRLNPVERLLIARSAVIMTIHNRLHNTRRKQSRSTGHGCVIQMDSAAQIQSIRHKLPRARDDIKIWQVVREDGDNKPYKAVINIQWVLEALDWLIEHNILYKDLKGTQWRNYDAIQDYQDNTEFVVKQHVAPKKKQKAPAWRDDSKVNEWADEIELGRSQPGLDENDKNVPALTPSFDVVEGDYVRYTEEVNPEHEVCPYNPVGTECMNPDTCMCKQIHKAIPSGLNNTAEERWCDAVDDETARNAATQIIEKERKSSNASKTTYSIHLTNQDARPHNE